ncbi:E3 ubiquitin-protein ligase TRIM39-like [Cygnus atratus]|uniref:E3 ubiquitin-protein ligase TRIM39-like n=1 Tax=Cygnus atratus TaxID=8868 RepID=UPI0015D5BBBF|nr:E3 ubiquitin-protein ligase TRIM39-like [Cygnus atratus]
MASLLPAPEWQRMILCSFCQELFKTLLTFDGCKHRICCFCARRIWGRVGAARHCPQCSMLPPARGTKDKGQADGDRDGSQAAAPEPEQECQEHQEALELFCLEDQTPICALCTESLAHRTHTPVPMEEAAEEYKRKLEATVKLLQQQKLEAWSLKSQEEEKVAEWKNTVSREREKIEKEFEKLHDFLDEEEEQLQRKLKREEKRTATKLRNSVTQLAKQSQALGKLITEIKERCQQPPLGLLKDIQSLLSRSENIQAQKQVVVSAELQDTYNIPTIRIFEFLNQFKVQMTLDPKSAHPSLLLSEDGQSVSHGGARQELPDYPERFDPYVFVLGSLRITAGRCYWEVEVGDQTEWDIGVCREAVKRKGKGPLSPQAGFWRMWLRNGDQYKVLLSHPITLSVKQKPKRVGIYLDYKGGEVSFYNVTHQTHLYTYSGAFRDALRPFFSPGLSQGGRNASPLVVCPSMNQNEG